MFRMFEDEVDEFLALEEVREDFVAASGDDFHFARASGGLIVLFEEQGVLLKGKRLVIVAVDGEHRNFVFRESFEVGDRVEVIKIAANGSFIHSVVGEYFFF